MLSLWHEIALVFPDRLIRFLVAEEAASATGSIGGPLGRRYTQSTHPIAAKGAQRAPAVTTGWEESQVTAAVWPRVRSN